MYVFFSFSMTSRYIRRWRRMEIVWRWCFFFLYASTRSLTALPCICVRTFACIIYITSIVVGLGAVRSYTKCVVYMQVCTTESGIYSKKKTIQRFYYYLFLFFLIKFSYIQYSQSLSVVCFECIRFILMTSTKIHNIQLLCTVLYLC